LGISRASADRQHVPAIDAARSAEQIEVQVGEVLVRIPVRLILAVPSVFDSE
jgi:hypothetical protein